MEVFLRREKLSRRVRGLLHARGGVSKMIAEMNKVAESSPRSWRCFSGEICRIKIRQVFSTLVEVFLAGSSGYLVRHSLLHARGGVSEAINFGSIQIGSSPRSWRCFYPIASK